MESLALGQIVPFRGIPSIVGQHDGLEAIADQLDEFKLVFDRVFELLARELPAMAEDLRAAQEALQALASEQNAEGFAQLTGQAERLTTEAEKTIAELLQANRRTAGVLERLRPHISGTARTATEVMERAKEVRMIALNASLVVARVGREGAAFGVITRELIEISKEQGVAARWVLAAADEIGTQFDAVHATSDSLAEMASSASSQQIGEWCRTLEQGLDDVRVAMQRSDQEFERLRAAIRDTMLELQVQDIMRQGFDHIRLLVGETISDEAEDSSVVPTGAAEGRALSRSTFRREACKLSVRLLDDIVAGISRLVSITDARLGEIESLAEHLDTLHERLGLENLTSQVGSLYQRAQSLLGACQRGRTFQERDGEQVMRLAGAIKPLVRQLESVEEQNNALRAISVEVKLETSRCKALHSVAELGHTLDSMYRRRDGSHREEGMVDSARTILTLLREESKTREAQGKLRVDAAEKAFTSFDESSRTAMARLKERLKLAQTSGVRLHRLAAKTREALRHLSTDLASQSEVAVSLADVASRADAIAQSLEAQGVAIGDANHAEERLRQIIEKFTLLSHRQLAESSSPDLAASGSEGELTLF